MPLLCISVLALLLLPLSLSCDNKSPPKEDWLIVQTNLHKTNETISTLLQKPCRALTQKLHTCTPNLDVVSTLYNLTCEMDHLNITHTDQLVSIVLNSLQCSCPKKPTQQPSVRLKRRTATRGNQQKTRTGIKKRLCKAKAILSAITQCYQMLNTDQTQTELRPN